MYKKATLIIVIFFTVFNCKVKAQAMLPSSAAHVNRSDSFYLITRNKAWTINKYTIKSEEKDKTVLFKDYTFRFNQVDSSKFLIEIPGKSSMTGHWTSDGNSMTMFSFPIITVDTVTVVSTDSLPPKISSNDSLYNEAAKLMSAGQFQKMELKPSKLKFKIRDARRGEILIEFTRKD
jgi:hypothetical protein